MCGRALTSNYGHSKPIVFISIVFNFAKLIFAYLWLLRFTCSPSFILCSSVQSFTLHWFLFAYLFALLFFSIIIISFCFLSNGFAMRTHKHTQLHQYENKMHTQFFAAYQTCYFPFAIQWKCLCLIVRTNTMRSCSVSVGKKNQSSQLAFGVCACVRAYVISF